MSKSMMHILATVALLMIAAVGLTLNFVAPQAITTWFGIAMGFAGALAAITACLTGSRLAIAFSVASIAASVATGAAGATNFGALATLAVVIAKDAIDQRYGHRWA